MNTKSIVLAGALLLLPSATKDNRIKNIEDELCYVLSTRYIEPSQKDMIQKNIAFEISKDLLNQIDTMCWDVWCPVIFSRSREDLRNTPLVMKGTKRHIGEYLGYDQYDYILKTYNNDTLADSLKNQDDVSIQNVGHIRFPLVYDEIRDMVPSTLHELVEDQRFLEYRNQIHDQDTIIVGMRQTNGKYSCLYYQKGKLVLATYASIGRWTSTPRWLYRVQYSMEYKRSRKYNNVPMPYALYIQWNIFIHQGKVGEKIYSKWCIRLPGLYAEALFYLIRTPSYQQLHESKKNTQDQETQHKIHELKQTSPKVLLLE